MNESFWLYEYLAAGLPVVSSPSATIEGLGSPAQIAGPQDFAAAVARAVAIGLPKADDGWVSQHTWGAVLDTILRQLDKA